MTLEEKDLVFSKTLSTTMEGRSIKAIINDYLISTHQARKSLALAELDAGEVEEKGKKMKLYDQEKQR